MMNENVDKSISRIGVLYLSYLKISVDKYLEFIEIQNDIERIEKSPKDIITNKRIQLENLEEKLNESFLTIIIFSSMFMESYIYDFGARNTSDTYISKYFDKIDTVSKWVIIPKIILGKEIDKSRASFETLKRLINVRNKIIHWKTKEISNVDLEKYTNQKIYEMIEPKKIFIAIDDIFKQLDSFQKIKVHSFLISYINDKNICG